MNGAGFVISAEHDLIIPADTVEKWRKKFTNLPDIEAAMSKLGTTILSKGRMHPGWNCPEGWMLGPLAEMNDEAANKRRESDARVANAQRGQPTKTFRR
jgi:hypothetical protein